MATGQLTTRVLDTSQGQPAAHVLIELWSLDMHLQRRSLLKVVRTNSEGRTEEPLLAGESLVPGVYELVFAIGDYFAEQSGEPRPVLPFLDRIPIRFGIADPDADYYIPLLVSPWAYSTYRVG
jgi:5-hydroxyisourate hydrolase